MKLLLSAILLVAMIFVIFKQKERIDTLTQSLAEQTEKVTSQQDQIAVLQKKLVDEINARAIVQQETRLSQPAVVQPTPTPRPLVDPNYRSPLDTRPTGSDSSYHSPLDARPSSTPHSTYRPPLNNRHR